MWQWLWSRFWKIDFGERKKLSGNDWKGKVNKMNGFCKLKEVKKKIRILRNIEKQSKWWMMKPPNFKSGIVPATSSKAHKAVFNCHLQSINSKLANANVHAAVCIRFSPERGFTRQYEKLLVKTFERFSFPKAQRITLEVFCSRGGTATTVLGELVA